MNSKLEAGFISVIGSLIASIILTLIGGITTMNVTPQHSIYLVALVFAICNVLAAIYTQHRAQQKQTKEKEALEARMTQEKKQLDERLAQEKTELNERFSHVDTMFYQFNNILQTGLASVNDNITKVHNEIANKA